MSLINRINSERQPGQELPDAAICRAARTGMGDLVYCMVDEALPCDLRFNMGENFFCSHPSRMEIIRHTDAKMNN
jgi:hypothetical protein